MHKHIDVKNNKIGSFLIFPTQSIDHCTFLDTVGEIYYPNSQDITTDTLELFKSDDDSIAQFRANPENRVKSPPHCTAVV